MDFTLKYKNIIKIIEIELKEFECRFSERFNSHKSRINPVLFEYFSAKGKLLRPVLIFLLSRAMNIAVEESQFRLAFADEMIHNATLIHDDIIDSSKTRRGKETLSYKYDSRLAVLAGDYLLSMALGALSSFNNEHIIQIHSGAIEKLINGEIEQYFNRKELISIDSYIEKSKNKTAELFKAGLCSACVLGKRDDAIADTEQFALNFGIAFQIHNDLADIFSSSLKFEEDINNGIYTAPWIFYMEEKGLTAIDNIEEALNDLKKTCSVSRTKELIGVYIKKAIENLEYLEDNQYKRALIEICRLYIEG